jgi:hypothetical protein
MTWNPTSPVNGATMGVFTAPTYTLTADVAPDVNGKQHAVTALGGTQTGVRVHSVSDPFTITFTRPKNPRVLPSPNPLTGKFSAIPRNTYGLLIRKGVNYAANQAPDVMLIRVSIDVPAGADAYDSANVRAALSLALSAAYLTASGVGDAACTGII